MMSLSPFTVFFLFVLLGPLPHPTRARKPHVIDFRAPNLYPEGIAWDPSAQHFIVGSLRDRVLVSVSDAGVAETLISDPSLPENVTILGLAVDSINNRVLAVVQAMEPNPPFNALAAYDLRSRRRLFLSLLPSSEGDDGTRPGANAVAVDFRGNAYVTNSLGNYIWKVNGEGEASVFSRSRIYTSHPVDPDSPFSFCGLNGVVYVSKGYLLVVQSNTGKMYKVDADDGTARQVLLNEDMPLADGVAMRRDGVVVVVSPSRVWLLKSQDSWGEAVVIDRIDLPYDDFATSVTVGAQERVYVVYSHLVDVFSGNIGRETFRIGEVRSEGDGREDVIWVYVMLGLGLAYFLYWRFQMRRLVKNLDLKTS